MIKLLKNKVVLSAAAAVCVITASQSAQAQTTLGVSATIGSTCIVTTANMAFGVYDPTSATDLNASTPGQVQLACTTGAVPKVDISNGSNFSVTRRMSSGANFLGYSVFQPTSNAAGAACPAVGAGTAWASGTPFILTAAPNTSARVYNVCGRITAGQSSTVGSYSDTLTATITF
ncbi:MAG: spore coat U domain-containing protein [Betaproteobacteria bacterium]|jgi:spore coat protein U-like protein